MRIRVAEERDTQALELEFLRFVSRDMNEAKRYSTLNLQIDRTILVQEEGSPFLGVLHWGWGDTINEGVAQIKGGRVLPTRRNQGIGSRLLEATLADMQSYFAERELRLQRVFVIAPDTLEAKRLFEKNGFQFTAEIPRHFADGIAGVVYVWEPEAQIDGVS